MRISNSNGALLVLVLTACGPARCSGWRVCVASRKSKFAHRLRVVFDAADFAFARGGLRAGLARPTTVSAGFSDLAAFAAQVRSKSCCHACIWVFITCAKCSLAGLVDFRGIGSRLGPFTHVGRTNQAAFLRSTVYNREIAPFSRGRTGASSSPECANVMQRSSASFQV